MEELKDNSRIRFNDLSQRIGKTEAILHRRIIKLQEEVIIKKFTVNNPVSFNVINKNQNLIILAN